MTSQRAPRYERVHPPADSKFDLAHLVIEGPAGEGSMGVVYRARDQRTGGRVALKVMRAGLDARRFAREATIHATIRHPNIVRYVGHGIASSGEPWLATEWLEGVDLHTILETRRLTVNETIALGVALSGGLGWVHARGLLHRDVKPSNVLLQGGRTEGATLIDFGLTRNVAKLGRTTHGLTTTGAFVGTPWYIAPEQALDAKRVDARADVFSLGCVLYHCLTGRPPFDGPTFGQAISALMKHTPPPITAVRKDVPSALRDLIDHMLAKKPEHRPANGATVQAFLLEDPLIQTAPVTQRDPAPPGRDNDSLTMIRVEVDLSGMPMSS